MVKGLLFRLDDIAPGLRRENLSEFERIFDKYNIKPLLGVVPENKDDNLIVDEFEDAEFWENVRRLQDKEWVISLHGYNHVYSTKDCGLLKANPFSEFAGIDYEKQNEKISLGMEKLSKEGIFTEGFMAPGHTFDMNTLRALKENGLKYVTDGYTDYPYIREGLIFVPCKSDVAMVPKGIDTMCIHLNNWHKSDFEKLEAFLDNNSNCCISWKKVLTSLDQMDNYSGRTKRAEERHIKISNMKKYAASNDVMQNYLKKSYSKNKLVKIIKRAVFLPMLLKK